MFTTATSSTQAVGNRNSLSRSEWAERITTAWQGQVGSIIEVGALLKAAKEELRRGDFMKMVKAELPFSQSTANKLMKIAACDHLRNSEHVPSLPAHWGTLFELTLLTAEQFEAGCKSGAINPKTQRRDVKALRGETKSTKESSVARLKQRLADAERELARLKQDDGGSFFDLKKDTPKDISDAIIGNVPESKARAIGETILALVKAKRERVKVVGAG
jgi:hypothetical protein